MSWDIEGWVEVDGNRIPLCDRNYTNNCNNMIRAAGWADWSGGFDGILSSAELLSRLEPARDALASEVARFDAMNPPNGWGSRSTLVDLFSEIILVAQKFPSAKWSAY